MTAVINGVPVSGTPEEIAKLITLTKTPALGIYPHTLGGGAIGKVDGLATAGTTITN